MILSPGGIIELFGHLLKKNQCLGLIPDQLKPALVVGPRWDSAFAFRGLPVELTSAGLQTTDPEGIFSWILKWACMEDVRV